MDTIPDLVEMLTADEQLEDLPRHTADEVMQRYHIDIEIDRMVAANEDDPKFATFIIRPRLVHFRHIPNG